MDAPKHKDKVDSGREIASCEMWRESWHASNSDSNDKVIYKHLWIAIERINSAIKSINVPLDVINDNLFYVDVLDEENDLLAYTSDNEEDVEGYESENEIVNLQWFYKENEEVLSGRSVVFSSDRINLPIRKLFHNALVFDTQSRPWCKGIVLTYAWW